MPLGKASFYWRCSRLPITAVANSNYPWAPPIAEDHVLMEQALTLSPHPPFFHSIPHSASPHPSPPQEYYQGGCRPHYMRLRVDPASSSVTEVRQVLGERTVEFPSVSPAATARRHSYVYCTADTVGHAHLWGPAQALMKITLPPDSEEGEEGEDEGLEAARQGRARRHDEESPATSGGSVAIYNNILDGSAIGSASGTSNHTLTSARHSNGQREELPSSSSTHARQGSAAAPVDGTAGSGAGSQAEAAGSRQAPHVEIWEPGPRSFCGEPMVVAKPGGTREDDVWVIVGVHNAETLRADVLIFDGARWGLVWTYTSHTLVVWIVIFICCS